MNVYRLCRKDEIDKILTNKNFKNVGAYCQTDLKKNSFKYVAGVKYLHFFKDKSSILFLNSFKGRYICCYDIPNDILNQRSGVGHYRNFINFASLVAVPEYAIESDSLKFEYLKTVDKIIQYIDYEDYNLDPTLKGFKENIYTRTNLKECTNEREM